MCGFKVISAYLAIIILIIFSNSSTADVINVHDGNSLHSALVNAQAGDEIVLYPGVYRGKKTESPEDRWHYFYSHQNGSAEAPILLRSYQPNDPQVLQGDSVDKAGYVFYLTGDHWEISDLIFRTGQKGIMLDSANHNVFDKIQVYDTGDEGIHFRKSSSYNLLKNCLVRDTGRRSNRQGYGEAVYFGSHQGDQSGDHSDFNRVGGCQLGPGVTAEPVDIKEGTIGNVVEFNEMLGDNISGKNYADSFIDIKGDNVIIRNNTFITNGNSHVTHGIHILKKKQHTRSNIYNNSIEISAEYPLIKIGMGLTHIKNNDHQAGGPIVKTYYSGDFDNLLSRDLQRPGTYTGHSSPEVVKPQTQDCFYYSGKDKTELDLSVYNCVEFDRDLSGSLIQVWDSNLNSSCNFRGRVESSSNASTLLVQKNYAASKSLDGEIVNIKSTNNCDYLLIRLY